jgi:polysaccharide pyruvyl transferase WcaK-like protein
MKLVNGFFPDFNFGDDFFLLCANDIVGEDYVVRNIEKNKRNYFSWLLYLSRVKDYYWLGGTFIDQDSNIKTLMSFLIEFFVVKLFFGKIHLISVGFSPELGFLRRTVQLIIISLSNEISVRDEVSKEFAKLIITDVKLDPDLFVRFSEKKLNASDESDEKYEIMISIDKKESLEFVAEIKNIVDFISEKKLSLIKITSPYVEKRQEFLSKELANLLDLNEIRTKKYISIIETCQDMRSSRVIITDRLHVALCGGFFGKTVVLLAVTEKLKKIRQLQFGKEYKNLLIIEKH